MGACGAVRRSKSMLRTCGPAEIVASARAPALNSVSTMNSAAMKVRAAVPKIRPAIVEVASSAIEGIVVEESSAVRFKVVVIKDDIVVMPVRSPVVPSPAKAAKETNAKTQAKLNSWSGQEQSGIFIPAWPDSNRRSIDKPGIVFRHVNDLWIGWFDHNCLSLL